jgi:hypothetical protein
MTPSEEPMRLYDDYTGRLLPARTSTTSNEQLSKARDELAKLAREFVEGLLVVKDKYNISYPDMFLFVDSEVDACLAEARILTMFKARKTK